MLPYEDRVKIKSKWLDFMPEPLMDQILFQSNTVEEAEIKLSLMSYFLLQGDEEKAKSSIKEADKILKRLKKEKGKEKITLVCTNCSQPSVFVLKDEGWMCSGCGMKIF